MKESETRQMVTTVLTVPTLNLRETETGPIRIRAPIYRKYVKRREKIETTKCHEINTQVRSANTKINRSIPHFRVLDCARSPKDKRSRDSEHRTNHDRSEEKSVLHPIKSQNLSSRDRKPVHNNCIDKVSFTPSFQEMLSD